MSVVMLFKLIDRQSTLSVNTWLVCCSTLSRHLDWSVVINSWWCISRHVGSIKQQSLSPMLIERGCRSNLCHFENRLWQKLKMGAHGRCCFVVFHFFSHTSHDLVTRINLWQLRSSQRAVLVNRLKGLLKFSRVNQGALCGHTCILP